MLATAVAMAVTARYGWTVERIAYRPLRQSFRLPDALRDRHVLRPVELRPGRPSVRASSPVSPVITGGFTPLFERDGFVVQLSNIQIIVVIATVIPLGIFSWLVARTRLGRDMRACRARSDHGGVAGR